VTTQEGGIRPRLQRGLDSFDFEIFDGVRWITLNDHVHFYVEGDSLSSSTQSRRRYTVQSSMYDGDWEVHSTASSVTEQVGVYILGIDQIDIADQIMMLEDAFTQSAYSIRVTRNQLRETWRCFPAEWTLDHGRIMSHNVRALMKFSIPRFPKKTYEAVA
jgi:hypothetical protein